MPVVSLWRAYRIPLPALVSAHPYGTLCTPPLDRDVAEDAVTKLMRQARRAGARAVILRDMSLDGPAMKAFSEVLRRGSRRIASKRSRFWNIPNSAWKRFGKSKSSISRPSS